MSRDRITQEAVDRIDRGGMFEAVRTFPRQWREGRASAAQADPGCTVKGKDQVVVAGMGGSAIGGDLLRTLALGRASLPVSVVRGYRLPASVGRETVVIISSYSGNTEETLAALAEALQRKATVVCVAAGGAVLNAADRHGLPFVQVPGGLQPRAALGYSLTALLSLAERMKLLQLEADAWQEAQALLEQQSAALADLSGNRALEIASTLRGRLPVVYSGNGLMEPANLRWRCQIQENSKMLTSGNVFPELNHNEIMGWEQPSPLFQHIGVVVLRDRDDHPRVQQRMEVTRRLLSGRAGSWTEVESRGEHDLTRLLSAVNLGDWVSLYLALLREVDPTPVGLIQQLKDTLSET